jgi:hypothetical protein
LSVPTWNRSRAGFTGTLKRHGITISIDGKGRCVHRVKFTRKACGCGTIGVADRLRFPRFTSQLGKQEMLAFARIPTGTTNHRFDIDEVNCRPVKPAVHPPRSEPTSKPAGLHLKARLRLSHDRGLPHRQQLDHFRHRIAEDDPRRPTSSGLPVGEVAPVGCVPQPALSSQRRVRSGPPPSAILCFCCRSHRRNTAASSRCGVHTN